MSSASSPDRSRRKRACGVTTTESASTLNLVKIIQTALLSAITVLLEDGSTVPPNEVKIFVVSTINELMAFML